VEEDLDHDEARGLEDDGAGLDDEADEVELELAAGGESDAEGDHKDDEGEAAVGLGDAGRPGNEQYGDCVECLFIVQRVRVD
jgi:hypothetical protein